VIKSEKEKHRDHVGLVHDAPRGDPEVVELYCEIVIANLWRRESTNQENGDVAGLVGDVVRHE
jgi:hypothetical protein